MPDRVLVARIRADDVDAYEWLFRTFVPPLCDFVFRYVESQDDAREIVQDLFFVLWKNRATWVVEGTLRDYLYAAARNRARDWLKHRRVVHAWRQRSAAEVLATDTSTNPGESPDLALIRADELAAIERALATLPERRRAICVLRWTDGLSYAQIAQRLGVSEKTVETQLNRAIHDIRHAVARDRLGG